MNPADYRRFADKMKLEQCWLGVCKTLDGRNIVVKSRYGFDGTEIPSVDLQLYKESFGEKFYVFEERADVQWKK